MLSLTVIVCETDEVLLQTSVNVHVRVMTNELAHEPAAMLSVPSAVISPEQLSVAVKAIMAGTSAAHATVTASGAVGATGAILSLTVIVWDTDVVLLQESVNVQVRVITYELTH